MTDTALDRTAGDRSAVGAGAATVPGTEAPLAQRVRRGLRLSLLNNVVTRAGNLIGGIALARLLAPSDYGVFAVALVTMQFLMSLNDVGLSAAIVRWPGPIDRIAGTASTVVMAVSALLYAGFFAVAPALAASLNVPGAVGILRLLGLTLLVDASVAVPTAILTREFSQGRRTVADVVNLVVYLAVAVTLASLGAGAWSLAWGRLCGNAVSAAIILYVCPTKVRPALDRAQAGELLRFGFPLAGSSFLLFLMTNVDYVVVGRMLGPVALGLYLLAFNLSSWPVNMFSFAVRRVSLAGFAQVMADRHKASAHLVTSVSLLLAVATPVCVLLSALAHPVIAVVYGARWSGAAAPLLWLALLGIARMALELPYDFLVAAGRPRRLLALQVLWVVALIPSLVLGALAAGASGVALGQLLVAVAVVLPAFVLALRPEGVSGAQLGRAVVRPLLGGAAMYALAAAVTQIVSGSPAQLATATALAVLAYATVVWPLQRLLPRRIRLRAAVGRGDETNVSVPGNSGASPMGVRK